MPQHLVDLRDEPSGHPHLWCGFKLQCPRWTYRWVLLNPNMDNPNSQLFQSPMDMTRFEICCVLIQNLLFSKEFYLVLIFQITGGSHFIRIHSIRNWGLSELFSLSYSYLSCVNLPTYFLICCVQKNILLGITFSHFARGTFFWEWITRIVFLCRQHTSLRAKYGHAQRTRWALCAQGIYTCGVASDYSVRDISERCRPCEAAQCSGVLFFHSGSRRFTSCLFLRSKCSSAS